MKQSLLPKYLGLGLMLVFSVAACTPAAPTSTPTAEVQSAVTFTISGSGTVTNLLTALQPKFEADNPGYKLNLLSGTNTAGGVQGTLEGALDAAAMAGPAKEEDLAKGLKTFVVGRTGVAIFAHPDLEVTSLTPDQITQIFKGEITNWSEVGGKDEAIIVFVREENESATPPLRAATLGDDPFVESAAVLKSSGDMLTSIAGSPESVGYGNWIAAKTSSTKVKAIAVNDVLPDADGYPMSLEIGLGYTEANQEKIQPLLDWLVSEKGRAALAELGVILPE